MACGQRVYSFNGVLLSCQTLELLFRITNGQNVTVIVEKMLEFLRISKDDHTTIDLVGKVAELAEKYPSRCHFELFVLFSTSCCLHLENTQQYLCSTVKESCGSYFYILYSISFW